MYGYPTGQYSRRTTKIRPVFNCFLKTGSASSLIHIQESIRQMICSNYFCCSSPYVLLGDIRKPFLIIKFKSEKDKNRFCFFMKDGKKLLCNRYTLIFGFNACPFILNFVIKNHLNRYPDHACTRMLKNSDNLCMTNSSPEELITLYKQAVPRLQEGNFQLRWCNSNCQVLKSIMREEDTIVQHGCEYKKVLGSSYYTESDNIMVAKTSVKMKVFSKSLSPDIQNIWPALPLFSGHGQHENTFTEIMVIITELG